MTIFRSKKQLLKSVNKLSEAIDWLRFFIALMVGICTACQFVLAGASGNAGHSAFG
jgi:hypothetical protein